jgi:hypothetical protein
MFQQSPRGPADGQGKGSVFYKSVSALGTALALGVSILFTPAIFARTRDPLRFYLSEAWGAEFGEPLTWAFGAVEAFALYALVKLIFTSLTVYAFAALAARRF